MSNLEAGTSSGPASKRLKTRETEKDKVPATLDNRGHNVMADVGKAEKNPPKIKGSKRRPLTGGQVMDKLRDAGVENLEKISGCVKAGIARGFVQLEKAADLDKVIATEVCSEILPSDCSHRIQATLRMVVHQKDWGGDEYSFVSDEHPVKCGGCGEGYFVSWVCSKEPMICYSKYMNHCSKCPDYGTCLGDCRDSHCDNCGEHYMAGSQKQMPCSCDPRMDDMMCGRSRRD